MSVEFDCAVVNLHQEHANSKFEAENEQQNLKQYKKVQKLKLTLDYISLYYLYLTSHGLSPS